MRQQIRVVGAVVRDPDLLRIERGFNMAEVRYMSVRTIPHADPRLRCTICRRSARKRPDVGLICVERRTRSAS